MSFLVLSLLNPRHFPLKTPSQNASRIILALSLKSSPRPPCQNLNPNPLSLLSHNFSIPHAISKFKSSGLLKINSKINKHHIYQIARCPHPESTSPTYPATSRPETSRSFSPSTDALSSSIFRAAQDTWYFFLHFPQEFFFRIFSFFLALK